MGFASFLYIILVYEFLKTSSRAQERKSYVQVLTFFGQDSNDTNNDNNNDNDDDNNNNNNNNTINTDHNNHNNNNNNNDNSSNNDSLSFRVKNNLQINVLLISNCIQP